MIYESTQLVELPITIQLDGGKEEFARMKIEVFVVNAENIPLLCGKNTMAEWNVDLKMRATGKDMMSIDDRNVVCTTTAQNHLKVFLHQDAFWSTDSTVYMVRKETDVETVEYIRNDGKLAPEVWKVIANVVENSNPNKDLVDIIWRSTFRNNFSRKNLVRCPDGEIRVWNKYNKDNPRIRENMAAHY